MNVKPARIMTMLAGLYLLLVFSMLVLRQPYFFSSNPVSFPLSDEFSARLFLGWGHFGLNSFLVLVLGLFGFQKKRPWVLTLLFCAFVYVFPLDLLATLLTPNIRPTPFVPAFLVGAVLWMCWDDLAFPKLEGLNHFSRRSQFVQIAGLWIFAIGAFQIVNAIVHKFQFWGAFSIEMDVQMAMLNVGWTNFSGAGFILCWLYQIKSQIKDELLTKLCLGLEAGIFSLLLASQLMDPTLVRLLLPPTLLLLASGLMSLKPLNSI
ncbi:MAG: hypothetical protein KDD33_13210 [Bdellovibrionales bacterium]|nr:hypothetical protein [Bdellovibrionales bacterium]